MTGRQRGFGTFGGVFVPNILTILGVIMYLRMGWVVGNAGLKGTLVILLIANLITLFTAFSISAIATNMKVRGGGAYYMISRSLGAEVGGSIGIPLYLAQALVISLYIVGFTESLVLLLPQIGRVLVNLITLTLLTITALISSRLVIRVQYIILSVILLSLVSFFAGGTGSLKDITLSPGYTGSYDFWSVFAVFFPAVTGILSGVSLSGDLRDPSRSIPAGTILSVVAGAAVYFLVALWFSIGPSREALTGDTLVMVSMARWGPLIYAGIWGATLSSALANILAAPRTLQALAADGIIFRFFGRGRGESNEPVIATLFTFLLVGAVLLVGELNTIAPVLTVFFLITYGSINLISFLEGLVRRPGFRPTFRLHWSVSLLGAAGCIWVMFLINPLACIIGFAFVFTIYIILKRIQIRRSWGDFRRGIWHSLIQFSLSNLELSSEDAVAWRPSLLLMSRDLVSRQKLIQVAFGLTRKSGLLTCINLFRTGEYDAQQLEDDAREFREMLHAKRITAFYRSAVVDSFLSGQLIASQVHGIGEFRHNTILLDWAESVRGTTHRSGNEAGDQFKLIRFYRDMKLSLLLLNVNPEIQRSGYQRIDLWWDPSQRNGSFMLLLAHLLTSSRYWHETRLTIKTIVLRERLEQTRSLLQELVDRSRIRAGIEVLSPDTVQEAVHGLEFERFRKKQLRRRRLINVVRGVLSIPEEEKLYLPEEEELILPEKESDREGSTVEEVEIKEKLTEQVRERDIFIINQNISEIIIKNSRSADLVMLGFNIPEKGKERKYIEKMESLLEKLPDTLLINCPFDFEL